MESLSCVHRNHAKSYMSIKCLFFEKITKWTPFSHSWLVWSIKNHATSYIFIKTCVICKKINKRTPFSHSWLVWLIRSMSCEHLRIRIHVWSPYGSCVSGMQILCFQNADPGSCVSRMQILRFQSRDLVFPQCRSQILFFQNADLVYPQYRHCAACKYASFEACMDHF